MIKSQLGHLLTTCFQRGVEQGYWQAESQGAYTVEIPKHKKQGDFSTNMALIIAGREKCNPRQVAAQLVALLALPNDLIARVDIAGPGFVNFFLHPHVWTTVLAPIRAAGDRFGQSEAGKGKKVLVEFVSANPTGPLSIGHGRNAILGDAVARLLEATGHEVEREYYFNDAGRQMRVLGASTQARYQALLGEPSQFPEDGYQGDYIADIAQILIDSGGRQYLQSPLSFFTQHARDQIRIDIDDTLKKIGIQFDQYFNEASLYESGAIKDVVKRLNTADLTYEKEGATWFKATAMGLEQDRVIIKSSGEPTYRLPDIAYHMEKFSRGYDLMINVLGADHIATVPDVLAGIRALGEDSDKIKVILHQFVTLTRDGKQVKMSTRKATFITVDELLEIVGKDALRFFFLLRKPDSQLEFDLDLATKQSQDNPVYYVQYAYARLCSIAKQAAEKQLELPTSETVLLDRLETAEEGALLKAMADYPAMVQSAADNQAPHRVTFYLLDLAALFHAYYNKHKVLGKDVAQSQARLYLCDTLQIVFRNGLRLLGVSNPTSM